MNENIAPVIDLLGELHVRIAELEAEAKKLKAALVEIGPGKYEGKRFQAIVTQASTRDQLDMKAVRAKLSPQFIAAHTTITPVSPSVRVSARMAAVA